MVCFYPKLLWIMLTVFHSDEFLGQCVIPLSKYTYQKTESRETIILKGEDIYDLKPTDNGEIDIKVLWTYRKFEDDLMKLDDQLKSCIKLQCWVRRILANSLKLKLHEEHEALLKYVRTCSVKITNICRVRLARKEYKRRLKEVLNVSFSLLVSILYRILYILPQFIDT